MEIIRVLDKSVLIQLVNNCHGNFISLNKMSFWIKIYGREISLEEQNLETNNENLNMNMQNNTEEDENDDT